MTEGNFDTEYVPESEPLVDGEAVLNLPMTDNDAGAESVRDYLKALLVTMFEQEESFSGKRPFGNSGWVNDLYVPIAKAGMIQATLSEFSRIESISRDQAKKADEIIFAAIEAL